MSNAQIALADSQLELLAWKPPVPPCQDGDLDVWKDGPRLNSLMDRMYRLMLPAIGEKYGAWWLPRELMRELGNDNFASVSARLRDMRKPDFGCPCDCESDDLGDGLFRYRLVRRSQPWPIRGEHYR